MKKYFISVGWANGTVSIKEDASVEDLRLTLGLLLDGMNVDKNMTNELRPVSLSFKELG